MGVIASGADLHFALGIREREGAAEMSPTAMVQKQAPKARVVPGFRHEQGKCRRPGG